MNSDLVVKHKLVNFIQSAALVLLLAGLMSYLALAIAGEFLAWLAFIAVVILFISNPSLTPQFILRMYDARPVGPNDAPQLHQLIQVLAERAGLNRMPKLYYIPSRVINAFAMGTSDDSTIAISDGVLRKLSFEELAGILAHEITHVRNNDIRVMTFVVIRPVPGVYQFAVDSVDRFANKLVAVAGDGFCAPDIRPDSTGIVPYTRIRRGSWVSHFVGRRQAIGIGIGENGALPPQLSGHVVCACTENTGTVPVANASTD
jgi:Zn-dependent protease with chaperone function